MFENEIIIVGGGLSGLTAAYLLARQGKSVLVIEKKAYPFHRVCGEYVSNEVKDFLIREDLFPYAYDPPHIDQFRLSAVNGMHADFPLDLGGFGISRYVLDYHFYQKCLENGVRFLQKTQVTDIQYVAEKRHFLVQTDDGTSLPAAFVLGAYGKRSKIDKKLNRSFIQKRSPYVGIKYHVAIEGMDDRTVALHNYKGGYLGVNKVENGQFNLCYLGSREQLKTAGSIGAMEERYLYENPHIRELFENAHFLWERPEVINEISFATKRPVENQILMLGDAAGMITPLCGNGMAIAIHTAKLVADAFQENQRLEEIQEAYQKNWNRYFQGRLKLGRQIQQLFGAPLVSSLAVNLLKRSAYVSRLLIRQTHGTPIQ
ncbi:Dehydrogenase (flavoprotein) [Cyclobacterium xiamenense]|uniref:Dehydrogenase (Flavoprotein) n=1 Tax=Cyclobacterium xiamenense TaxID=1297121 RepID=A0A1H6WEC8_9BACT|nr:NAD(P)/FAD-dependent oxidoreductase [Cyclobacterium xiamenense]SEJ10862.1 Dehydrogenase (flavoprotein) [Cyclobacterium xiamenense]